VRYPSESVRTIEVAMNWLSRSFAAITMTA
jgi:hypothetical protein